MKSRSSQVEYQMISYGRGDTELFRRMEKPGFYTVMLAEFNLVQLDHRRGPAGNLSFNPEPAT